MRRQSYTPSIHTVQSRRGVRQRLDRRCHAVDVAYTLTALQRGASIHLTFTKRGKALGIVQRNPRAARCCISSHTRCTRGQCRQRPFSRRAAALAMDRRVTQT